MSQYPNPYGYGQYHGQPPPQPSHPPQQYGYQNVSGYPAPGYNNQFNLSAIDLNRDAAQASFQYNAAHIPGLGIAGAAPGVAHYNPVSGSTTWSQPHFVPPPASSAPPALPPGAGSFGAQHPQTTPPGLTASRPRNGNTANTPKNATPVAPIPTANTDVEEGELSEGQFEDLYEPRESIPTAAVQAVSKLLPIADPSQPTSAVDTPEGGFYGTDEDDGEKAFKGTEGTT